MLNAGAVASIIMPAMMTQAAAAVPWLACSPALGPGSRYPNAAMKMRAETVSAAELVRTVLNPVTWQASSTMSRVKQAVNAAKGRNKSDFPNDAP